MKFGFKFSLVFLLMRLFASLADASYDLIGTTLADLGAVR